MVPHHKCKRGKAGWSQLLRFIPKKLKWRPLDWNVSMLLIWMGEVQLCVFIAGIKSVLFKSKYHFYLKAFPFYMLGRNQWSIWPMRSLLLLSSYHRTHTGKLFLEPSSSGQVHNLTAPSLIGLLTVSLASREDGHITGVSNKSRRLPPPHPTPPRYHRLPWGSLVNRNSTSNVWPQRSRNRRRQTHYSDEWG